MRDWLASWYFSLAFVYLVMLAYVVLTTEGRGAFIRLLRQFVYDYRWLRRKLTSRRAPA